jgi:hypothetical protein
MTMVFEKRKHATISIREANLFHDSTLNQAGIEHTDREPGFPCWKVEGVEMNYCGTPREALVEANRIRGLDMTVEEAREKRVCRVCKKPIYDLKGTPKGAEEEFGSMVYPQKITYHFGKEFAHTDCLPKEESNQCTS